jgi:hypothetical protein
MKNELGLQLLRLTVLIGLLLLGWYFFNKDNDTAEVTQPSLEQIVKTKPTAQDESSAREVIPDVAPNLSEDQTILMDQMPDESLPNDLGGIDNIPTEEMQEAMMEFAPEANDDGIPGPAPEEGDDGLPGEPPEGDDAGFIGEPPEGYGNDTQFDDTDITDILEEGPHVHEQ